MSADCRLLSAKGGVPAHEPVCLIQSELLNLATASALLNCRLRTSRLRLTNLLSRSLTGPARDPLHVIVENDGPVALVTIGRLQQQIEQQQSEAVEARQQIEQLQKEVVEAEQEIEQLEAHLEEQLRANDGQSGEETRTQVLALQQAIQSAQDSALNKATQSAARLRQLEAAAEQREIDSEQMEAAVVQALNVARASCEHKSFESDRKLRVMRLELVRAHELLSSERQALAASESGAAGLSEALEEARGEGAALRLAVTSAQNSVLQQGSGSPRSSSQ